MNQRAVGWLLGCVSLLLAAFLLVPVVIGYVYEEQADALAFLFASGVSAVVGAIMIFGNRGRILTNEGKPDYFRREGLATVALSWLVASALGSLPCHWLVLGLPTPMPSLGLPTPRFVLGLPTP